MIRLSQFVALAGCWLCFGGGLRAESTRQFDGVPYVEAGAFFRGYGLDLDTANAGRTLRARSVWTQIDLPEGSREIRYNGVRVFLGESVERAEGKFWLSEIDASRMLAPWLRASDIQPTAPVLKRIVIDAGHGGKDRGTSHQGLKLYEKVFSLDVAKRVAALLKGQGYDVQFTRDDDTFIDLEERPALANKAGADLFVSIHFNAVAVGSPVHGTETYVLTPRYQRSTTSRDRAASDADVLTGNTWDPWNAVLAYQIQRHLVERLDSFDRGLKRARFVVLKTIDCPAVLVEAGYLTSEDEARKINRPAYRQKIAEGIVNGIRAYDVVITAARKP